MDRRYLAQFVFLVVRLFFFWDIMSRLTGAQAAQAAGLMEGGDKPEATHEDMTARLQSILADAMVDENIQDGLAQAGLLSIGLFSAIGSDDKAVKEFLADVIEGLDPAAVTDRAERAKTRMEITRICSAHAI